MSPEEQEARLVEQIRADLARLETVVAELDHIAPSLVEGCAPLVRMAVAGYLHSCYTGCEAILKRIARVAGDLPSGKDWHQALLYSAAASIAGVRPSVVAPETATALGKLLNFRHFFRNAYGVDLEVDRLREHVNAVPATRRLFVADLTKFMRAIDDRK